MTSTQLGRTLVVGWRLATMGPLYEVGHLAADDDRGIEPFFCGEIERGGVDAAQIGQISAVDAARRRSAARTSGRRLSKACPSPVGSKLFNVSGVWQASNDRSYSSGGSPINVARRKAAFSWRARSGASCD